MELLDLIKLTFFSFVGLSIFVMLVSYILYKLRKPTKPYIENKPVGIVRANRGVEAERSQRLNVPVTKTVDAFKVKIPMPQNNNVFVENIKTQPQTQPQLSNYRTNSRPEVLNTDEQIIRQPSKPINPKPQTRIQVVNDGVQSPISNSGLNYKTSLKSNQPASYLKVLGPTPMDNFKNRYSK